MSTTQTSPSGHVRRPIGIGTIGRLLMEAVVIGFAFAAIYWSGFNDQLHAGSGFNAKVIVVGILFGLIIGAIRTHRVILGVVAALALLFYVGIINLDIRLPHVDFGNMWSWVIGIPLMLLLIGLVVILFKWLWKKF